jgi:large subunit ribosomal protein L4
MELKVTTLEGKAAGSVELSDGIFGLEPRKDIIQRCVQWQLNKRQAGTHKAKGRAEIWRTGKKMYKQKGTGGARHGSARVPQFRGGGRAFGPVVRSHATGLPKKVRALALRHALSAKAKDGSLIVIDKAALEAAKTKALITHFSGLGVTNALIIDGAELHTGFATAARNIPNIDVLPIQGINVYDILRREKLVLTKAALDALEARFYDIIVSPVVTEKATMASEHNKVVFKVASKATKPQIKEAVEKLFDVKVKRVNTLVRKGKTKVFRGSFGSQSDVKRAVVTLEEGHRIDVTTGL